MAENLYFKNPVFFDGENLTVRRGIGWAPKENHDVLLADSSGRKNHDVLLADSSGMKGPSREGRITRTIVIPFSGIPEGLLEQEHDPECRTWNGLFEVMKKVYPGFMADEVVTLVFFTPGKYTG